MEKLYFEIIEYVDAFTLHNMLTSCELTVTTRTMRGANYYDDR
jgi:hypothetical protein